MRVRKATLPDSAAIHGLIFDYARQNALLPRPLAEICENIRDFMVAEHKGEVIGCAALHIYGMHLAELRSIAVSPHHKGLGAGRALIKAILAESRQHRIACVCLFTRIPAFFAHLGFTKVRKERLPDKLYKDCRTCRNRKDCDEVALVRGRLPKFASLEAEPEKKRAPRRKGAKK